MTTKRKFLPYNKSLTALARHHRKNPTPAETRMWNQVLRMRLFAQYKFLRQKPIASFIVDFYCSELGLVIEIDGDGHGESGVYDTRRTKALNGLGLKVVRYANRDVMHNVEGVHEDLVRLVEQLAERIAR